MRWIEIGSQPMSATEKSNLRELFPEAKILQHYGLTEASRTTLLRIDKATPQTIDSVGQTFGDTKITTIDGKIAIKGSNLASGAIIDGKITPLVDEQGWFTTSDLGEFKNDHLFFYGRSDNTINCGGQKVSAESIENYLIEEFGVGNVIGVSRVADENYGEGVLVAFEKDAGIDEDKLCKKAISILSAQGISAKSALRIFPIEKLPITETGKLQRNVLASSYATANEAKASNKDLSEQKKDLSRFVSSLQQRVGMERDITASDSIASLCLDSISTTAACIEINALLGQIPDGFRSMTFEELFQTKEDKSGQPRKNQKKIAEPQVKGSTNENPRGLTFIELVREDFATHDSDFFSQGFWAVFNHRFGNWRMGVKSKLLRAPLTILYRMHRKAVQIFCGIKLDYTVRLGRRVKLEHFGGIIVGAKEIGDDVTLRQNTTLGIKSLADLNGKPTLEQGVNVAAGVVIVGDIRIGKYSVIGPNCVISTDIPEFSVVESSQPKIQAFPAEIFPNSR